ncbi:MAG TPA: GDSL-type esterase/lipase family protein [Gillisia sp.]|nr:GDSL-type esterase/lipase family protein [Gillisia sp.]
MNKFLCTGLLIMVGIPMVFSQEKTIDSSYNNTYYQGRMEVFNSLPKTKDAIVFVGNSITERAQWNELLPGELIINRGIGGDNTFGLLARLEDILSQRPGKLFLMIGINDIGRGLPLEVIKQNYTRIVKQIQIQSPRTRVYIQSVLPLNDEILSAQYLKNKKITVLDLNRFLKTLANQNEIIYIDLYNKVFSDGNNNLKPELTIDGIHLKPISYVLWTDYLKEQGYL